MAVIRPVGEPIDRVGADAGRRHGVGEGAIRTEGQVAIGAMQR